CALRQWRILPSRYPSSACCRSSTLLHLLRRHVQCSGNRFSGRLIDRLATKAETQRQLEVLHGAQDRRRYTAASGRTTPSEQRIDGGAVFIKECPPLFREVIDFAA